MTAQAWPSISVVTPAHNAASTLPCLIANVRSQTDPEFGRGFGCAFCPSETQVGNGALLVIGAPAIKGAKISHRSFVRGARSRTGVCAPNSGAPGARLSMRGIATVLNERKQPTPRDGAWHPQHISRIVRG
jgi:hypothetical protein